jgi:protein-tyrosine phosphatase
LDHALRALTDWRGREAENEELIDLHCHVLPAVDDGPRTVEEAVALARGARDDGITTIAATPHVDASHPGVDSATIGAGVRALQARLNLAGVDIRVVSGAEVSGPRAVELDDAELRKLTLGGGPWLLLECPLMATLTPGFATVARSLVRRGHDVLLAHPERSPLFQRSPQLLDELIGEGMLAQVTAGALSGRYGRTVRDLARRFVQQGSAQVVASDGHGAHRPARIAEDLVSAGISPSLAAWLAHDVPAALLAGDQLPSRPEAVSRRPRGRRIRLASH